MKFAPAALCAAVLGLGFLSVSAPARADSDDIVWIAQCEKDNASEGAAESVIHKYCVCMDNKMSSEETKSVTDWEKTHPTEMAACDKEFLLEIGFPRGGCGQPLPAPGMGTEGSRGRNRAAHRGGRCARS